MITLPFLDFANFNSEFELDGNPYVFQFNWNSNGGFWTMKISDTSQNVLVSGIKLVLNYEHIKRFVDKDLPPGELWVRDPSDNNSPIEQYDFLNDRCFLTYVTEEELA
jgi:hypothetical protein